MSQLRLPPEPKVRARPAAREVTKKAPAKLEIFLLSCGIVARSCTCSPISSSRRAGRDYSHRDQTISELNAIGAPTRTLSIVLGIAGYAFLVAFGVGVWRAAAANRRLRVAAGGLIALGVLAWVGVPFFPMHVREAEETLTDALHVAQLAAAGPLLVSVSADAWYWWLVVPFAGWTIVLALRLWHAYRAAT